MASIIVDNKKITGGIISTPGINSVTYYCRLPDEGFVLNNGFNGVDSIFDWIVTKTTDSRYIKSGVVRNAANRKTIVIPFDTSFSDTNYYVFFSPNKNINTYWCEKKVNRFVVSGSSFIGKEISWIAIHKDFAAKTGIANPGTIFTGRRRIFGAEERTNDLDINVNSDSNTQNWINCEYIIKPGAAGENFAENMNLDNYTVVLSTDSNINTFWLEKTSDRVKIGTSFGKSCIIDYLIIKTGIDWWKEF